MASNDTAALVVALSAQLSKFEKDMRDAVGIADKRAREIETRFAALNGVIASKMSQIVAAQTSQIGFFGQALSALGPAGVTAAVGIGATVGIIVALIDATERYAEKAKILKEGSETIGLTINQYKLLGSAGKQVGLDFDETTAFFAKYIANLQALREGGGPLYDALLKIDVGLLRQLASAKDSVKAIDLLVAAYKRLADQTARLDLAKAAGGRAGLTGSRLLESLGNQGGLTGLEAANKTIDEDQIRRAAQLKLEISSLKKQTETIWGEMFSDRILNAQKQSAQWLKDISEYIARIVGSQKEAAATSPVEPSASLLDRFGPFAPSRPQITVTRPAPKNDGQDAVPASVELALLQRNLALLGDAVTQGEQWRLKRLEIAAAAEKGGLMDGVAGRALAAFNVTMAAAATFDRPRGWQQGRRLSERQRGSRLPGSAPARR